MSRLEKGWMKPFDVVGNVETGKKKTEGYHGMYE
jgi:hypothetical protein